MNCIALDTATESITIAIEKDGTICEMSCTTGLKHAANLLPMIESMLSLNNMDKNTVDALFCTSGPGSFTGLRIGMTTCKGMAMGLGIPIVSVPTLDTYAFGYAFTKEIVVPVIDARKKRVYAGLFLEGERISPYIDDTPEKVMDLLEKTLDTSYKDKKIVLTGPGVSIFAPWIGQDRILMDYNVTGKIGRAMITLGKEKMKNVGGDPKNSGPMYLRKSEAELDMKKGAAK